MRLFYYPVSLVSPHKHRISISRSEIFEKNLRGQNPKVIKTLQKYYHKAVLQSTEKCINMKGYFTWKR